MLGHLCLTSQVIATEERRQTTKVSKGKVKKNYFLEEKYLLSEENLFPTTCFVYCWKKLYFREYT